MKKVIPKDAVLIPDNAKKVFDGVIFDVYHWQLSRFDSSISTWEMIRRPDTVTVIGICDDKILVIDDDQPHVGSRVSFPGGRVDEDDETILHAAKREMLEETGYEFEDWKLVRVWQPHTKLEWFIYLYIAQAGKKVRPAKPDAGEKITLELLDFDTVKNLSITKSGYLAESKEIFENVNSLRELTSLQKFQGIEVDR